MSVGCEHGGDGHLLSSAHAFPYIFAPIGTARSRLREADKNGRNNSFIKMAAYLTGSLVSRSNVTACILLGPIFM